MRDVEDDDDDRLIDGIKNTINDTSCGPPLQDLSCVCQVGNEDVVNEGHEAKSEEGVAVLKDSIVNVDIDPEEEMADSVDDIVGNGDASKL